jgi:hypothetical protein
MRKVTPAVALLAILMMAGIASGRSSRKSSAMEIDGPTVIAFYPEVSKTDRKNSDADESLSEFQLYAASARQRLESEGVNMQEVFTRSFEVVLDGRATTFRPSKATPGYYFATPGRKPRIEYGVMSDTDILRVAKEYFGAAMK